MRGGTGTSLPPGLTTWAGCLAVLALAILAQPAAAGEVPAVVEQLVDWMVAEGGEVSGYAISQECPTCQRGVIASRDLDPGDVILRVPLTAVLQLPGLDSGASAAEHARLLLHRMHSNPHFNASWGLFWASQPAPGTTLTPEVFTDELLAMLQTPELEYIVRQERDTTEQLYHGTHPDASHAPLADAVPDSHISLDTFKWVASLLTSRWWWTDALSTHLVPLLDMVNHHDSPNARRFEEAGSVVLKAIQPIKQGQEVTINYQRWGIHRPDRSLFHYGFVAMTGDPLLCSIDLPPFAAAHPELKGDSWGDLDWWLQPTAPDDSVYDDGSSEAVSWQEHARLTARLAALPTSEEEDRALLDGGTVTDWQQQVVLQFRILRKRALRIIIDKVATALAQGGSSASACSAGVGTCGGTPAQQPGHIEQRQRRRLGQRQHGQSQQQESVQRQPQQLEEDEEEEEEQQQQGEKQQGEEQQQRRLHAAAQQQQQEDEQEQQRQGTEQQQRQARVAQQQGQEERGEQQQQQQQRHPSIPMTFWVLAIAGGVNCLVALALVVLVNQLVVTARLAAQAAQQAAASADAAATAYMQPRLHGSGEEGEGHPAGWH